MPPIVFYFPYPRVGGVSVLFLRLARRLAVERDVYLMDLPQGYMASNLPAGVRFIPFDRPKDIPTDALVVFQSAPPWRIENLGSFPPTARLLFWNLHPNNLNPLLFQQGSRLERLWGFSGVNRLLSLGRKRRLVRTCQLLCDRQSLVFMDAENHGHTQTGLGLALPARLLPITTDDRPEGLAPPTAPVAGERLRAAWVGRLEDFKIPILLHTLSRLDAVTSLDIDFEVIGEGAQQAQVEAHVRRLQRVAVQFRGHVSHTALDAELQRQHVVFAMGTAALDSARLGLPTFCLDFAYRPIEGCYRYRLLREIQGYNVGEQITAAHMESVSSLESTLQLVVANYGRESDAALAYWVANHSPQSVLHRFGDAAQQASATIADLVQAGLHRPDPVTALVCGCDPRKVPSNGFILR